MNNNRVDYPEKYNALIDEETWAFIEHTNTWYPPDVAAMPIEKNREIYNAMCREFFNGYPQEVVSSDQTINVAHGKVACRLYSSEIVKARACVVYGHGGGFVVGGLDSHDDICAEICAATGFNVFSIDYRLSPEHAHPAAFDDMLAGFEYTAEQNDLPIVMAGDSAGATLAAAVCHQTRGAKRKPVGQVLIYPSLGGDMSKGSYVEHGDAPLLNIKDMSFYTGIRSGGSDFSSDPSYAPLVDRDFSQLPPSVIISAQCDLLSDDGREYRDRILQAGGRAVWFNETGLVHGYLRARHSVERAKGSFTRFVDAISMLGEGRWSY
ncbi:MAG: alpha/beta hydrolase [Rhizobiaceae bacterium]|nr:alpha/beta hydrolase [Rhizobiaceae bacterium]